MILSCVPTSALIDRFAESVVASTLWIDSTSINDAVTELIYHGIKARESPQLSDIHEIPTLVSPLGADRKQGWF